MRIGRYGLQPLKILAMAGAVYPAFSLQIEQKYCIIKIVETFVNEGVKVWGKANVTRAAVGNGYGVICAGLRASLRWNVAGSCTRQGKRLLIVSACLMFTKK
jgi:hypothetical protein